MQNSKFDSAFVSRGYLIKTMTIAAFALQVIFLSFSALKAETLWTPSLELSAKYDDNVLFDATDTVDDYVYIIEPGLRYDYNQELTHFTADARAGVRRYQDTDDLDDETYGLSLAGDTNFTQRFNMKGKYEFIKDKTLDSELLETGRAFFPEDRFSHRVVVNPEFYLTERTIIGLEGRYRDVSYDSDRYFDYKAWSVYLPVKRRLETQIDTISLIPGYTFRESDKNESTSYIFGIGWTHETTQRLTFDLTLGARYTDYENLETGQTDENWGGAGALQCSYDFETGNLMINFERDLKNTAGGDQAEVTQVNLRLRWNFTARLGAEVHGGYYYTVTEGEINDDTTEYIKAGPYIYYHLTQNHDLFVAYEYSQEYQKDVDEDPRAERNRVWAGIRLTFPL